MSNIYDEMQTVAGQLFDEFNQGVIEYVGVMPGSGPDDDPGEPTEFGPYRVNGTVRGVSAQYVDGTQIKLTDLEVSFAFDTRFAPRLTGFMNIDGVRHKIVKIMSKPEAGTPVAYTVVVRK